MVIVTEKIIIGNNSSMSFERIFKIRKLVQSENRGAFDCDGLTDRLRVLHNSAKPSSRESIILYLLTWKYCDYETIKRYCRYWPKESHIRLS